MQTTQTNDVLAKLSRIKNYSTRYEMVATNATTGESVLVCYTPRNNRRGMLDAIRNRAEAIKTLANTDAATVGRIQVVVGDWTIRFSGRTQREAIIGGELRFIGN